MARKFQFDDEDDDQKDYQETSHIDELENMKATQNDESVTDTYENKLLTNEIHYGKEKEEICLEMVALCFDCLWCAFYSIFYLYFLRIS